MAFESGFNAGASLPMVDSPYKDLLSQALQGYKGGVDAANYPQAQQLAMQKQQLQNELGGLSSFSGDAKDALGLALLKQRYGENSEVYQNAIASRNANLDAQKALTNQRETYTKFADKRFSTPLAKIESEIETIQQGFKPGTNGEVRLNSLEQQQLLQQYSQLRDKQLSDPDTRKRINYATNLEKTMKTFNPKDLVQYSGIKGQAQFAADKAAAAAGKAPERYRRYEKAKTAADLLAKQARQFYGDSIQESAQEQLKNLSNPSGWLTNPDVALEKYNQFADILNSELKTFTSQAPAIAKIAQGDNVNVQEDVKVDFTYNPETGQLE